jgi:hypothetical protein
MIPISKARYSVTIVKTMMNALDYQWRAETKDYIGISTTFYDNNHMANGKDWEMSNSPEKAVERFKLFAEINGIENYEINTEVKVLMK